MRMLVIDIRKTRTFLRDGDGWSEERSCATLALSDLARDRRRPSEFRWIDRDVRLHVGNRELVAAAQPRVRVLERHHHAGDRAIVLVIELRRNASDGRAD